jgi:ribosomal protein S18 acetylase RimI-like enzyme
MEYKYKIDVATADDVETLVNFQLAMARESEGSELDYATVREGVKTAVADGDKATYLVARDSRGEVLGSLMLTTEWSDWNNCDYFWVQSVYVRPESRHNGVLRELLGFARTIAEAEGNGTLRLYVDKSNLTAQQAYRRLGMHESHYLMYELT